MNELINNQDLLKKIQKERTIGLDWIRSKRETKLDERGLYVQEANKDKVNIHSIYLQMQVLMSLYYADELQVRFCGRSVFTEELADNISKVAEFDYDQMDLEMINYDVDFDSFYVGVGVKLLEGWNPELKTPYARRIDPLTVIPDPKGGYSAKNHRWIGFEVQMTKREMREKGFSGIEHLGTGLSPEEYQKEQEYNTARGYTTTMNDDEKLSVYYHYTDFEGKKYLTATTGDQGLLVFTFELEPETEAEKKNPLLVPFPVSFTYFSPMPNDFYGISVVDLLKDKQTRFSRLFNLEYIRAVRNALGDDKLYDSRKIQNIRDLLTPTPEGRYIEATLEPGESLADAMMTVEKQHGTSETQNMMLELKDQMVQSTGIDPNTAGIGADQARTLGEAQMIQQNANSRFSLITKARKWGEKDFWKLYYRSLQYNLSGEKIIRLTRSFGDYYVNFKREDIVGTESIDIKIQTKSELEAIRMKESATFFATYAADLQMASSEFQRNFIQRKKYRLQGWSADEIRFAVRDTNDEILARQDVQRLNYGLDIIDIEPNQDHLCFLAYYENAIESDKKRTAIEKRKQALYFFAMNALRNQIQQQQMMQQQQQGMGNISTAQTTNNAIQQLQSPNQVQASSS